MCVGAISGFAHIKNSFIESVLFIFILASSLTFSMNKKLTSVYRSSVRSSGIRVEFRAPRHKGTAAMIELLGEKNHIPRVV